MGQTDLPNVTLQRGLPEAQRSAACALYWQAFGGKLGFVMGPQPRAMAFLLRVMRLDHCIAAIGADAQLLGIVGYKSSKGSFAGGTAADMRAVYGPFGTLWRLPLLALLSDEDDRFMLDGISVDKGARSMGIGRALITAMCDLAQAGGYDAIRLDVVDTNWRARALYARMGFVVEKMTKIGLLRYVFGFNKSVTMVKTLGGANQRFP